MEHQYKTTTATSAVLHFSEHGFRLAFKGKTGKGNPDYFRAVQIIKSARSEGGVSDERARWLLENYGGEVYRVESRFEVAIQNPCIYCGSECREVNVLSEEFRGQTLTYAKYVCTSDPNHFWQSGKQMDETQANGPAFKAALEKFRAEGGEEIETKI